MAHTSYVGIECDGGAEGVTNWLDGSQIWAGSRRPIIQNRN